MALDYFKGFNKVRQTKGTKIYYARNYIALATLGCGIISGILLYYSKGLHNITTAMNEDWFTTPEERERKKLAFQMGKVPTNLWEKIAEKSKMQKEK